MHSRFNYAGYGPAYSRKDFPDFRQGGYRRPKYNVPVNIAETDNSYEVMVYATGFTKENIKLSIVEDTLYISGTRTLEEKDEPDFVKQEFPVKSFERTIELNKQVDRGKIKARQQNEVLIITLPKTQEARQPAQEIRVD
ncbi:MAG: Hsp20/alpha crystallin family protein [Chitinophagales bacterium]